MNYADFGFPPDVSRSRRRVAIRAPGGGRVRRRFRSASSSTAFATRSPRTCRARSRAVAKTGLRGRRVLLAVLLVDAAARQGRPQAARRSRHQLPVDAQQRDVVHARRPAEGHRAEPDYRQPRHHHGQCRAGHGHRRLEGVRRPAERRRRNAEAARDDRPGSTITRPNGGRSRASARWTCSPQARPKDVVLQFDVGTCVEAGADPVAWIKANPGTHQEHALQGLGGRRAGLRRAVWRRRRAVARRSSRPPNRSAASSTT